MELPPPFEPSLVRRALDELLRLHPHLDVLEVDWQLERPDESAPSSWRGPWVLVELGQPSDAIEHVPAWAVWRFAIWRSTGSVYAVGADGAVGDDPVLELEASR